MVDVVEVDPRDCLREQVVERRRHLLVGDLLREPVAVALERPGDEGAEAARLVLHLANAPHVLDALLDRLHVPVHHRRRRRHPELVRVAHHVEPLRRLRLLRRDDVAHAVDEDLAAAAGDRVQAGVAQARERLPDGQLGAARDVLDLGGRERVQMDLVALLDRAEEVLVVIDPEVGMVAALHEQAGAAHRERLLDLLEDDRLREQVALVAVARAAIEGAEVAVGDADVRVVEVAVDDERDPLGIGLAPPQLVGRAAHCHELARAQQRHRLLLGDALAIERLLQHGAHRCRLDRGHASASTGSFWTKRSSGTCSSAPTSRAISRKV